jgi:hypothetical protein
MPVSLIETSSRVPNLAKTLEARMLARARICAVDREDGERGWFTHDQVARIETPYCVRWWGRDWIVTPCLVRQPMGDGRKLFAIQPLDTRPHYYVVALDSRVRIKEQLDEILDHIEEQVGDARDSGQ